MLVPAATTNERSASPDRAFPDVAPALREAIVLAVVVGTATFLAYREALGAWFAADDFLWLEIGDLHNVLASFVGPWGHGAAYRPLSRVSFFIDRLLFGLDATPWHVHSLLVHAATATLLGWLVRRVSGERALALATATIFALQPLGYQNTIWISGRSHPLALGWALLALIFLDRRLLVPTTRDLVLAAASLALSLLVYEASVDTLPLALLLIILRRRRIVAWRAAWRAFAVLGAVTGAYLAARRIFVGPEPMYPTIGLADLIDGGLLRHLTEVATRLLEQLGVVPPWLVVAGLALALLGSAHHARVVLVGAAIAAIGFLPFVLVTTFSVRFAYASEAGLALVAAAALCSVARWPYVGRPAAFVLFVLLVAGEWHEVRDTSHQWQQAGTIGKRALANIAARTPDPAADGIVFVVGTPRTHGRAMVFYTYFDVAMRVFQPGYGRLALSAHYVSDESPDTARAELAAAWQRAQARRADAGRGPLRCADGPDELAGNGSFAALSDCRTVFLELNPFTQAASPARDAELRDRLRQL